MPDTLRSPLSDAAHALFAAAVEGATPATLLPRAWPAVRALCAGGRRVCVVGAGKAALAMAAAVEAALDADGTVLAGGTVVVPHGYRGTLPAGVEAPRRITVTEAGHPLPDAASMRAAHAARAWAEGCSGTDRLLVLLSGGASALWGAPAPGVTLAEARDAVAQLQAAGADIAAVNALRRVLTLLGGGRLAAAAHPTVVGTLVLSDVVGDDPSTIASGPTTTAGAGSAQAERALRAHGVWDTVPASVRARVGRRAVPPVVTAMPPVLLGGIGDALAAARRAAERLGFAVRVVSAAHRGEARDAGRALALAAVAAARATDGPTCLLWGGETTVTRPGGGRGGRNQELALAAAVTLDAAATDGRLPAGAEVLVLSGGTDGIDGPTDAAGAWVTEATVPAMRAAGMDAAAALAAHDAHPALDAVGALVRVGPTHTNVMDVQAVLVRPASAPHFTWSRDVDRRGVRATCP